MTQFSDQTSTPLDLSQCDREPIHIPDAIQPHGMLLAITEQGLAIVRVSSNCEEWLQQPPQQLIGQSLEILLTPESVALLRDSLSECGDSISSLRTLRFALEKGKSVAFSASVHRSGSTVIVELDRLPVAVAVEDQVELNLMGKCRLANRRLGQCKSVEELCQVTTQELSAFTDYDRIMVYQFDDEWNGAVRGEQRLESQEPYLGLHFPATDIPAPARAMLLQNGLRVIADVQYQPAPLFPRADARDVQPLDLSRAQLRSVSPIHLEYLRNMEVQASLTISLLVDGKLWGLIACHHRSPYFPSPMLREACELFGQLVSMQLSDRIQAVGKIEAERSREVLHRLANRVRQSDSIIPALTEDTNDLLELTNSQGVVLYRDGQASAIGVTPPLDSLREIQRWVVDATSEPIFVTDRLPNHLPAGEGVADVASGMLALALSRSPDVYVLWFRPEVIQMVDWAGDPSKSIESVSGDGNLHPRNSFALWKQSVRNRSQPWLKHEIESVRQLQSILQDQIARNAEQLRRLLPICAWCKKVRSDHDYWQQVEEYVGEHSDMRFTHGICPTCMDQEIAKMS